MTTSDSVPPSDSEPVRGAASVRAATARIGERVVSPFRGCIVGTTAVVFLIACGRWGSHMRIPDTRIYLTDILLAGAAIAWFRASAGRPDPRQLRVLAPLLAVAAVAAIRFVAGRTLSADSVRDVVPYLYAIVALLPGAPRSVDAASRTLRLIRIALILHGVFVAIRLYFAAFVNDLPHVAPGPESQYLGMRADFDSAVLAVLVFSSILAITRHGTSVAWRAVHAMVALASVVLILEIGSRAGLLTLLATTTLGFAMRIWPLARNLRWSPLRIACLVAALAVVVVGSMQLGVTQRIKDTPAAFGIGVDESKPQADATGTAQARLSVWKTTMNYVNSSDTRVLVGVGFGPDFLHDSGTDFVLEGQTYSGVRAPHNYLINTYARMGIVGVVVVLLAILYVIWCCIALVRLNADDFDVTIVALLLALFVASLLGVIFESPFGAVPGFWAAGWVVSESSRRRGRRSDVPPDVTSTVAARAGRATDR